MVIECPHLLTTLFLSLYKVQVLSHPDLHLPRVVVSNHKPVKSHLQIWFLQMLCLYQAQAKPDQVITTEVAITTTIMEATSRNMIHLKKQATRPQLMTMATIHTTQLVLTVNSQATLISGSPTELASIQLQDKSVPTLSYTSTGHFTEKRITIVLVKITNT
jgi:hypothetical protein